MQKFLLLIAGLGLIVAGYLVISYAGAGPIVCGVGHGCDTVRASQYAELMGIPTPVYGVAYYFLLGLLAVAWTSQNKRALRWPLLILTGSGLAVSGWLTYLEAFVIEAWCAWCVASAVLAALAFWQVWFRLYRSNN